MLRFKMSDLKPIVEHAEKSPFHKPIYGQKGVAPAGLWLVKDHGVYLMSNGDPSQKNPAKETDPKETDLLVCYAEGHDPRKGDTWDADRQECGGDDFGEFIEVAPFRQALDQGMRHATIKLNKRTFRIGFSMR
jgi:hypothetical protein